MRENRLLQQSEKSSIERRFGQSSEKEVLEWTNSERNRLKMLLEGEKNIDEDLKRSVYAIIATAESFVKKLLDEFGYCVRVVHAINGVL
jgi:hypothetical protein